MTGENNLVWQGTGHYLSVGGHGQYDRGGTYFICIATYVYFEGNVEEAATILNFKGGTGENWLSSRAGEHVKFFPHIDRAPHW